MQYTTLFIATGTSAPPSGKLGKGLEGWQFGGESICPYSFVSHLSLQWAWEKEHMKTIKNQEQLYVRFEYVASS